MYRVCIALVNASRVRLFTYHRGQDEAGLHDGLAEHGDLLNAVKRRKVAASSLWGPTAGAPGVEPPPAQLDAGFARIAMAALRELIDDDAPQRVLLCAPPTMLHTLRMSASGILPADLPIEELPRDLVALSSPELRSELATHGVLSTGPTRMELPRAPLR
jgi:hypothetical protein